jgi:hypothetical protein
MMATIAPIMQTESKYTDDIYIMTLEMPKLGKESY